MFKLLLENDAFCHAMETLGENFEPGIKTLNHAEKAICNLYNAAQCSNNRYSKSWVNSK